MVMTSSALNSTPVPQPEAEEITSPETPPIPSSGTFDVLDIEELEDGSAIISLHMDFETLRLFAKIGMMKVFEDAANKVITEHGSA